MERKLALRSKETFRFDIDTFPSRSSMYGSFEGKSVMMVGHHNILDMSCFLLRRFGYFVPRHAKPAWKDWVQRYREYDEILTTELESNTFRISFLRALARMKPVVNGIDCIGLHWFKPWMFFLLKDAGVDVPEFVFGNSYSLLTDFIRKEGGTAVYKPLCGGREARPVTIDYVRRNKRALGFEPIILQRLIRGESIRSFVLDDEVIGSIEMKHQNRYLDFRIAPTGITVRKLPQEAEKMCVKASMSLGMKFCGVDLVHDAQEDRFFVLECNDPTGFAAFEKNSSLPISDRLADFLISLGR